MQEGQPYNPVHRHASHHTAITSFPYPPYPHSPECRLCFFFSFFFFHPFSDQCYRASLYPTRQVLKPPPLHHALPLKPHKSCCHHCLIHRHISKVMFFSFFFIPFLINVTESLFIPFLWSLNPTLHYIFPTPMLCPSSLASPAAALACICRHASKDMFFFSFFRFFSDQCYGDPLYPTCWVLKPLPLHHIIPPPVPCPSSLASPCRHLCLTACKPGCLHLCHMQVHRHHHPITACKIHPQC